MSHYAAQVVGSVAVVGYFALVVVFGPRAMLDQSWRSEIYSYEQRKEIESSTTDLLTAAASNIEHLSSVTNLTHKEWNGVINEYSSAVLPNASVLVVAGKVFKPRWNESNARGAFLESVMLADNNLIHFPSNVSMYMSTIVFAVGIVAATMICASMVATYHHVLMKILYYVCGMNRLYSVEEPHYLHVAMAREAFVLAVSILFALFTLAQACVFGWLESAKEWKFGDVVIWGTLQFTGISHSPVKPGYMMGIPQMTSWLSLCNFCMYLHTSASIGLLILSAVRCFQCRNSLQTLNLTDEEEEAAVRADNNVFAAKDKNRPLFHN